jgi:hypothetical protein
MQKPVFKKTIDFMLEYQIHFESIVFLTKSIKRSFASKVNSFSFFALSLFKIGTKYKNIFFYFFFLNSKLEPFSVLGISNIN